MRGAVWALVAVVAIVGGGPLAAAAAPTPRPAPSAAPGLLGAVSGLTSLLPPVGIGLGGGRGTPRVTIDAGSLVRRVLGTAASRPAAAPGTSSRPTPAGHPSTSRPPYGRVVIARPAVASPGPVRTTTRHGVRATTSAAEPDHLRPPAAVATPSERGDGPLGSPSRAVQALLHMSLGSDDAMLVILGVTALGAVVAMGTVVGMGRRPRVRPAPVR